MISPSTRSLRFHSLWVLKTVDGEARRTPINELAGGASTELDLVQGPGWFWIFGGDNRRWVQKTWIDWNRVIVIGAIINYANTSDKPELLHFIDCTNRRVIIAEMAVWDIFNWKIISSDCGANKYILKTNYLKAWWTVEAMHEMHMKQYLLLLEHKSLRCLQCLFRPESALYSKQLNHLTEK